ncbi:serine hydrolase domain-containing protein [Spongiivirga citrea]|uniref:Serine hydrolase n=1 Tax=Spongiivirga citrea TaxID=1481457 RepID=A0A6M0CEM2_9FLAO|nr:serine hydrolase domain-containing protein [Spongiivirga citrea]NER15872.1 serine hydrolase [Spongiivirga citrea]
MKKIIIPLLLIVLVLGCSEDEPQIGVLLSDEKELLEFKFLKSANQIEVNSIGEIDNTGVLLFLPPGSDLTNLKPEFVISSKAKATVNGQEIISGQSTVDFQNGALIKVTAEDGSDKIWDINIIMDFPALDAAIASLMTQYETPGFQLAILKDEKLVYRKSYGESNVETGEKVTNSSRFRVASVSKPITQAAILKLAEDLSDFSLDDKVFGPGSILGNQYGTAPYTADKLDISVRHLMDHESGWTNTPNDPMFSDINLSQTQIIDDMVDNRALTTTPGSTYSYSNFGYSLLGRIIEELSGMTYENYINQNILAPSGVYNMEIAGNTIAERKSDEVYYYSQESTSAYDMNVRRMDAHGGWIANATDLAEFLTHIDRNSVVADIITTSSSNETYFGFFNWLHTGSLPGTASILNRLNDSFGYAIIGNSRTRPSDTILDGMQLAVETEINTRTLWPSYDLIDRSLPISSSNN